MPVHAIAEREASQILTPDEYRALARSEPHSQILAALDRASRSYLDAQAAAAALQSS